jgi:hypothetical protein
MAILLNIPITEYHAHDAETNSKLKVFREGGPLLYKRTFLDKVVTRATSEALKEGAGFDSLIFDGDEKFAATYVTKPPTYPDKKTGEAKPWNMNADFCKAWVAAREAEGKVVLDVDAWTRFVLMRDALRKHPLASALLARGEPQVTFRNKHERFHGLEVQVRPDQFGAEPIDLPEIGLSTNGLPWVNDLKTTDNFSDWWSAHDPEDPRRGAPVWKYAYHRQGGLAQSCISLDIGKTAHFLTVVEKQEPFRVGVIQLSDAYLDLGWSMVEADLKLLAACKLTNKWPGSPEHIITLEPPLWLEEKSAREAAVGAA